MSDYPNARIRRENLLIQLRMAPLPLSTVELWKGLPQEEVTYYGGDTKMVHAGYSNAYANLRQLEVRGLVVSLRPPDATGVYWVAQIPRSETVGLLERLGLVGER